MLHWTNQPVTIIKTPPVTARASSQNCVGVKSVFDALKNAKRASSAGSVLKNAHEFSSRLPLRSMFGVHHSSVCIKAPGTDFLVPPQYAQTASFVQKVVDYHYSSDQVHDYNRNGDEYCHLIVFRGLMGNLGRAGPFSIHLDLHLDGRAKREDGDIVYGGEGEAMQGAQKQNDEFRAAERYTASDKSTSCFFDTDIHFTAMEQDLIKLGRGDWRQMLHEKLMAPGVKRRRFAPYEITHFNTTTGHSQYSEGKIQMRTLVTAFIAGNSPSFGGKSASDNPYLAASMIKPTAGVVLRA